MTAAVEGQLLALWDEVAAPAHGVALAAVGSLARFELGPRSDIDLVLLHNGKIAGIQALADRVWYPLWDSRVRLDHAVRTPLECAEIAGTELSAGVALLDLRIVAGDASLIEAARTSLLGAWRGNARSRLPELLDAVAERHSTFGDAAHLLEPDLKQARGGFRDMNMLRALAATWLTDRPHVGVREPYDLLLDVRDALHLTSGRAVDRLLVGEVSDVADLLGYSEPDALHRAVSLAARQIGHAVELTARAARQAIPERRKLSFAKRERRPIYEVAEHDLIVHQGEVGLGAGADPADPLIGLRAGALASRRGLVLSPVTAENLGRRQSGLPHPWPTQAREALLDLLSGGQHLIPVWEALDLAGCVSGWFECWEDIRARPQHNPIHRHTVDRHIVQTVAEVASRLTSVDRPDLLLLACLFHDIGKLPGTGVDHAAVGAPIARRAVRQIGLDDADADVVELLVAQHLTLAELATKRDHQDPATLDALVKAVQGRADLLDLLRHLTEADARAAGPAAWSSWRASLINKLADQAAESLVSGVNRVDVSRLIDLGLARSVKLDGTPRIRIEPQPGGVELIIAVPDRLGLFGETAGLLAAHSLPVRSAVLHTVEDVSVNTWRIDHHPVADLPDAAYLVKQLQRLEAGDARVLEKVRRREARTARSGSAAPPYVEVIADASQSAAVVETRAGDRPGLLYTLGSALSQAHLSVRSAHISTLAGQAIDTFYLTEADGSAPSQARTDEAVWVLARAAAAGTSQADIRPVQTESISSSTSAGVGG